MSLRVLSFSLKTDYQSGNLSALISVLAPQEKAMAATAGLVHGAYEHGRNYGGGEGRFA